jgi:hypothetical protein
MVALGSILLGSAFGLCFRVWILLPASIAAIVCMIIYGAAGDMSLMLVAERSVVAVLALEAGYCIGLASRHAVIVARAPVLRKAVASARRLRA